METMSYLKKITVDDVYVSVLSARRELTPEGDLIRKPFEKDFPHTGSIIMDAVGKLLRETRTWRLADLAERLRVDTNDLYAALRILTEEGADEFISTYRLKQAKEWLACTDLELDEVARRCGLNSPEALMNRFRRREKTTPTRYRKTRRPKNFRELYVWE